MSFRPAIRAVFALPILGLVVAAWVDLRPWRPLEAEVRVAHHAEGAIRAGAGRAEVRLPSGIPLAGFRPLGREATKEPSPVRARTLLLEAGGVRTALVLLELMTLPASLSERIADVLREEGIECALVAATHTHSGPGAYDRAFLPQLVAIGRFDPRVEEAHVEAVRASLVEAQSGLAPARLFAGEGRVALATNRDREGRPVDDRLGRIEVRREDGGPLATVLRVSAHPTIGERAGLSGDWPGHLMSRLEERGGVAFVLQGASGDAMVEGEREVQRFGGRVLRAAEGLLLEAIDEPPVLGCRLASFSLPPPDLSAMAPRPLGRLVSNLAIPFAPRSSELVHLQLGELSLLGIPGEPTAAAGRKLEAGRSSLRTIGLAGDFVGYVVEAPDMRDRVFSARNAWFGSEIMDRIVHAADRLVEPTLVPAENGWSEEAKVP